MPPRATVVALVRDADGVRRRHVVARTARHAAETFTLTLSGGLTMAITVIPGKSSFDFTLASGEQGQFYCRPTHGGDRAKLVAAFLSALKHGQTVNVEAKPEPEKTAKAAKKPKPPKAKTAKAEKKTAKAAKKTNGNGHPGPRPAPKPAATKKKAATTKKASDKAASSEQAD
jgi:hypothetical protein